MSDRVKKFLRGDTEMMMMREGKYSAITRYVHPLLGHGKQAG